LLELLERWSTFWRQQEESENASGFAVDAPQVCLDQLSQCKLAFLRHVE
jgi:hypothetical protein